MQISYQDVQKTSPTFACNFYSWKKYCVYLFIFNNVNTINYLRSFKGCFCPECKWYAHKGNVYLNILISYLHFSQFIWISYEFSKFWSNGQRAFEGPRRKSKGKTEQARKVRAKLVGRNQLGVKMQLSLFWFSPGDSLVGFERRSWMLMIVRE